MVAQAVFLGVTPLGVRPTLACKARRSSEGGARPPAHREQPLSLIDRHPAPQRRRACLALCGSALLGARALAQAPAVPVSRWDDVRAAMRSFVRDPAAPSVSVAVAMDGRIAFADAAGLADRTRRVAATPATAYSVASVSKPITATAVMRLVERGVIGLDEPANRYLGAARLRGWEGDADAVTVRHLLSHTAGLPEHLDFHYADERQRPPPMATTLARYGVVAFEPGSLHQYANLGYGALAAIVARQSRRPFGEAVQREVFAPLGMGRASVRGARAPQAAALRYDARGRAIADYRLFEVDGASAVHASASDLARFGLLHLGAATPGAPRLLSDATIALMQQRATPPDGAAWGLGWELGEERGVPVVQHSGGMPGVRARLTLVPTRRAVIVVLVNGEAWPEALYERLLSIVGLPDPAPPSRASGSAATAAKPEVSQAFAGEWRGSLRTYAGTVPFTFELRADGSAMAALGGGAPAPVEELTARDGFLYGFVAGTVPTADARRRPGKVWMQLRSSTDLGGAPALVGVIYQDSVTGERDRYTLGAPLRLRRVS
jgi:CubicO group peptidase (beta-lactamase class C family)